MVLIVGSHRHGSMMVESPFGIKIKDEEDILNQRLIGWDELVNLLLISLTLVILDGDSEEVEGSDHNINVIIPEIENGSFYERDVLVVLIPGVIAGLQVVNFAEIKGLLGIIYEELMNDFLGFLIGEIAWISLDLSPDGVDSGERIFHPVSHAFVRDKVGVRFKESLDGDLVHSSEKLSHVGEFSHFTRLINFANWGSYEVDELVEDWKIQLKSWHLWLLDTPTVLSELRRWSHKLEVFHHLILFNITNCKVLFLIF